jgi:leucyl aminopeptidase
LYNKIKLKAFHFTIRGDNMNIQVMEGDLAQHKGEAAVLIHFEGETKILGMPSLLDKAAGERISGIMDLVDFKGKKGEVTLRYTKEGFPVRRVVVVGLGKRKALSLEGIREAFAKAAQRIRSLSVGEFSTSVDFGDLGFPVDSIAEAVTEGVILGLYDYLPYKTVDKKDRPKISSLKIYANKHDSKTVRAAVKRAEIIADAVCFARDLVSAPANEMTPSILAAQAKLRLRSKDVKVSIIHEADMKKLHMNALLGVAKGSHEPPKMIVARYNGGRKSAKPIVLVGKGITFDSGGISIKPAENMDRMKTDMAGGAAVIATIKAVSELSLPINLVGIVPATENLPGGNAYKPGDILRAHLCRPFQAPGNHRSGDTDGGMYRGAGRSCYRDDGHG